jgi:alkylated DNA repair dioxygenase AlkB
VHGVLSEAQCAAIVREVGERSFEKLPPTIGPVRQEAELLLLTGELDEVPSVARLREELVAAIRDQTPHGTELGDWWPTEAYVQRYEPGALGVTAHVDSKRFELLIAVFTLRGSAEFLLCEGRSGNVIETWETRPGTLVLLRGPGLGGLEDGRPFHAVRGPAAGQRYSLTFRMNAGRAP